jgi:hypothetical protein
MGMHFKQIAEFLGVSDDRLQSAAQRCGVSAETIASGRLGRGDLSALLKWAETPGNAEHLVNGGGSLQEEVLKRLSYLASADGRFRLLNDPSSGEVAPPRSASPRAAFSLFLAPATAKPTEVVRLLVEISNLQQMLGGNGIDYRLAGVRRISGNAQAAENAATREESASHSIIRWESLPRSRTNGRLIRRDLYAMEILGRFLGANTIRVDALGEEYVRGAEADERDPARVLAEEIGASTAAQIRGGRDATLSVSPSQEWLAKLAEVEQIESRPLKFLTLTKFFDENAALTSQLAQIMGIISSIRAAPTLRRWK